MSIADIINSTSSTSSSSSTSKTENKSSGISSLSSEDFLKLMLAQLKNQDPMNAMDPNEYVSQLAQFTTASGTQEMQTSIATLSESMRSSQMLEGSSMIGREILVAGEGATLGATGSVRGAVDVPSGAVSAQINIRDASGQLVRSMPMSTTEGLQDFTWDGATSAGERAPAGEYDFEVVANVGGANESLETLLSDRVTSVTIDATNGLTLNTASLGPRALDDVRRVM